MKFNQKLILINIVLILACVTSVYNEKTKNTSMSKKMKTKNLLEESRRIDVYKDKAKDYIIFARMPYCSTKTLLGKDCNLCAETRRKGYKIIEIVNKIKENLEFNMIISKSKEELIFSFGGPKSSNIEYFEKIYTTGFRRVNDIMIENEFYFIYENFFKNKIITTLKKFDKDTDIRILFIGHSLGGSLAQLAAFDLVKGGVLQITERGPFLITYGALKIGPKSFVDEIQQKIQIPVLRISRKVDLFSLMPRCIWIPTLRVFHCYRNYHNFVRRFPIYTNYYLNYSPIAHTNIIKNIPADILANFKSQYVIKQYNPEIIKTIVIQKTESNPNGSQSINPNNHINLQKENDKKEDKLIEDIQKDIGSKNDSQKQNQENKDDKPSNNASQKSGNDKLDKINKDKDNQDIVVINDSEVQGNNNFKQNSNNNGDKDKINEDGGEKKKNLTNNSDMKKEANKPNEGEDDRINITNRNGIQSNINANNNNQIKNAQKINEPVSISPLMNNNNPTQKLSEFNMGSNDNFLNKPDSVLSNNPMNNSYPMNIRDNNTPSNFNSNQRGIQELNNSNSPNSQPTSQNNNQHLNKVPQNLMDDKDKLEKHQAIRNYRFAQKKNYDRYMFVSENNKIILFGNQVVTDSLSRFCSSHDDYLSCKFNFADHRKFYGIDIESCE